ncbi:MAG: PP2C family protein-serine/threonine phosphatase [Simkaniaceae bacterium]|nr:PP2C family protein-serine/threonine phosphatase [Candidatus Sacchlamyda saccharinae]
MNISLVDHHRSYQLIGSDLLMSFATGLSGAPYALRHHQLAQVEGASRWTHRIICLAEFIPVMGAAVALVERIFYTVFSSGYSDVPWRNKPLNSLEAMQVMQGRALAAAKQHHPDAKTYASSDTVAKQLKDLAPDGAPPIKCSHHFADNIGPREQMEDAHFYQDLGKGVLAGVFDGHGGKEVSEFASIEFQKRFPKALEDAKGNVHNAFETLIHHIHQDIARHSSWNKQGSTAVVTYIDKESRLIYTATLGDSEANIYRNNLLGSVTSIPLSFVHDWTTDVGRLVEVFGKSLISSIWMYCGKNPKHLRSRLFSGVNVSRAFGDVDQTGVPAKPLVTHEPVITVNKLQSKDVVILACDGLKDYVPEQEISDTVGKVQSVAQGLLGRDSRTLAKQLVDKALLNMQEKRHGDNVTVLAIDVA